LPYSSQLFRREINAMSLGCMCLLLLSVRVLSRRIILRGNALIEAFLAASLTHHKD
jgi:hypothetical protein